MADRSPPHQLQAHTQQRSYLQDPSWKLSGGRLTEQHQQGPSASKILAIVTLVPVGGTLLVLSGLTLAATLFGLAVSTPVLLIFSPVIVPAALTILLAIAAFLTSGVFGLTALSSLSWVYQYIRRATGTMPEQMDIAKRRMQEMDSNFGSIWFRFACASDQKHSQATCCPFGFLVIMWEKSFKSTCVTMASFIWNKWKTQKTNVHSSLQSGIEMQY